MAIGIGSIVAPTLGNVPGIAAASGPLFGVCQSASAPYTVLFYNGQQPTGILAAALDEITVADAAVANGFVGRRVEINSPSGQNNWGTMVCVAAYKRTGVSWLLLQNPTGEFFVEAPSANCTALKN